MLVSAGPLFADAISVDFEDPPYITGSIHTQDGWSSSGSAGTGCAVYDHAVVTNTYGYVSFDSQSLRMSNAVTSGCFSDQTFSKSLTDEAGETSAVSDGFSGGTRRDHFVAQWEFGSTVPGAEQPGLSVVASPDRGDGARMSWVQMADAPSGLQVNFYDYQHSVGNFVFTNVITGLDRTVTHTVKIEMFFVDGAENDVVKVYVDGVLGHVGTSWEDYFRDVEGNPTRPVDSILFRTSGTAVPATAGKGFVIDNLNLLSDDVPQCTTTCYVDAVNGSDGYGGTSIADAKKTIQAAIDAVSPGGTVRVLPGTYSETATNRLVLGSFGPYQFGLFIGPTKNGITVMGVTAGDVPITDPTATLATVNTNATNTFGYSGVFVEGDNVTMQGLKFGPNTAGDNKTIEIIGDAFVLKYSTTAIPDGGGAIYFGDWRFDTGTNTSYIKSYNVESNYFDDGTQIAISNGAGFSGPLSGRTIISNTFVAWTGGQNWPHISFNGAGGVPWYTYPVGGANITSNSFTGSTQHIRARGDYTNSDMDWTSFWNDNDYNKAVVDLIGAYPPFDVRTFSYMSGSYTFTDVRRIGAVIQGEIDNAQSADTVLVRQGIYPESPNVTKGVTIMSLDGRDVTTITLQSGPTYLGGLTVITSNVTIDGFTIKGRDAVTTVLASSNIVVVNGVDNIKVRNARILVGQVNSNTNGDDGIGLLTYYSTGPDLIDSLTVTNTIFMPVGASGQRAFYINPGVDSFVFMSNTITGKFDGTGITQAQDGLVEGNNVQGVYPGGGDSRGLGAWGYPDPAVWGHTTFRSNVISGTNRAIGLFDVENMLVEKNILKNNDVGVQVIDTGGSGPFDASTIVVRRNDLSMTTTGMSNGDDQTADGRCNWWGAADGPGPVGPGSGSAVSAGVTFSPFLLTSDLDGPCAASLTVKKVVVGPSPLSAWAFAGPTGTFTLPVGGGQRTFYDLASGTYAVTETTQVGYVTAVGCDNGASGVNSVAVNLGAYAQVTCAFTNTRTGGIVIEKRTVQDAGGALFTFSGAVGGAISHGGQLTATNLAPGQYTVSEADPGPTWALSAISCDDGASATPSTTSVVTRTATIHVDVNEIVTCVFTNTRTSAMITIIKEATPKSTQNFNFTAGPPTPLLNGGNEVGALGNFILDDAVPSDNDAYPKQRSFVLPNGVYNFGEAPPSNWKLKAIECTTGGGSSVVVTLPNVAITLGGGDVTCTFKNQLSVTIQTLKYKDNNGNGVRNAGEPALAGWQITATLQPTGTPAYGPLVTNGLGRANFNFLPAGTYKVCEVLTGGWTNTQPGGGSPCYTVTLNPGQTASVNFGNKQTALPPLSSADTAIELAPLSPYAGVTIADADPNALDGYAIDWTAWVDAVLLTPVEEPVDAPDATTRMYLPVVVK